MLIIKNICIKSILLKDNEELEMKLLSMEDEMILNKIINNSNVITEGNQINLVDIETQKIQNEQNIDYNYLTLRLFHHKENKSTKSFKYKIKLSKEL